MDQLTQKNFTSSRSLRYHYYVSKTDKTNPTLLFLHGWPDSSALYQHILPHFIQTHNLLIADLLGHGLSSKPLDASLYGAGDIAKDIHQLLESEGVGKFVAIGHDWGSAVAQRVEMFFPEKFAGLVLLSVGYSPPIKPGSNGPKTVDQLNNFFEKVNGYRRFEYHTFFLQDDATEILDANLESAWTALHVDGKEGMKNMLCKRGVMREYISSGKMMNVVKGYARDEKLRDAWIQSVKQNGGIRASLNWYHAIWDGHHAAAEKDLPEDRAVVKVPVLYLNGSEDAVCLTGDIQPHKEAGLLLDLTVKEIEGAGHWLPYEVPEEVAGLIKKWFQEKGL